MNKKPKLVYGIKGKLVSAACMLLVAVIMVVSSTYAWFTLSTAPEVTGIQTAVGANGSLEMALLPTGINQDGSLSSIDEILGSINSSSGDSLKDPSLKNITWGNLVDLSNADFYGWNNLILYPSQLNKVVDGNGDPILNLAGQEQFTVGTPLMTPEYGADGRVAAVTPNTSLGIYNTDDENFPIGNGFGVRAIGVSSGLTDRQLAFRNAVSAASTAKTAAKTLASRSLNKNGGALANIAMEAATTASTIARNDVVKLKSIVDDLIGSGGVLDQIETSYKQYILAYAASSLSGADNDTLWRAVNGMMSQPLSNVLTEAGTLVPAEITAATGELAATRADVVTAGNKLDTLLERSDETYTWDEVKEALNYLVIVTDMTLNGKTVTEVKANMGALASDILNNGLTVAVPSGAGVYADVADHCGDYKASVVVEGVEYNGVVVDKVTANMTTKTSKTTPYLTGIENTVSTLSAPEGAAGSKPMTEFYGYIIDMAFRTNAPESNLLLQTTPVDRIYEGNNNADTIGHGSTMTFATTATGFGTNQVVDLMKNIRIVFFNPVDGSILANARLDIDYTTSTDEDGNVIYTPATGSYTVGADGVTANIYLYDENGGVNGTGAFLRDDAKITALTQNVAQAVSVLVYLDGSSIENADVASNGTASMSGTMNLQFASDADLTAMEYGDLHTPDKNVNTDETTQEPTT